MIARQCSAIRHFSVSGRLEFQSKNTVSIVNHAPANMIGKSHHKERVLGGITPSGLHDNPPHPLVHGFLRISRTSQIKKSPSKINTAESGIKRQMNCQNRSSSDLSPIINTSPCCLELLLKIPKIPGTKIPGTHTYFLGLPAFLV